MFRRPAPPVFLHAPLNFPMVLVPIFSSSTRRGIDFDGTGVAQFGIAGTARRSVRLPE
jgi:hypothetical protein